MFKTRNEVKCLSIIYWSLEKSLVLCTYIYWKSSFSLCVTLRIVTRKINITSSSTKYTECAIKNVKKYLIKSFIVLRICNVGAASTIKFSGTRLNRLWIRSDFNSLGDFEIKKNPARRLTLFDSSWRSESISYYGDKMWLSLPFRSCFRFAVGSLSPRIKLLLRKPFSPCSIELNYEQSV